MQIRQPAAAAPWSPANPPSPSGDSYNFTFTTPGTYESFCPLHPQMVAKVIVVPAKGRK